MRAKQLCPECFKPLDAISEWHLLDGTRLIAYKCGHFFSAAPTEHDLSKLNFTAVDNSGKKARHYQEDGVRFIIEADFNCIIGDQMRLGKTPQVLLALQNAYTQYTPCLIVVRAANLWQWIREYKVFADNALTGIYPIIGTKAFIPPGFSSYIISMDTLGRRATCALCSHGYHEAKCTRRGCLCREYDSAHDSIADRLKEIPFKLIIVDEAHSLKNPAANRSQAVVDFLTHLNTNSKLELLKFTCYYCKHEWQAEITVSTNTSTGVSQQQIWEPCPNCKRSNAATFKDDSLKRNCSITLLTGTAVKNSADELFVPLNLVAPARYPSLERFRRTRLMQDSTGRWSRINPYVYDQFKQEISDIYLRREKEDVYTDLPVLDRIYTIIEPQRDALVEQYNKILDKIGADIAGRSDPTFWDLKEDLMSLRRITALMKLPWVCDYCEVSLMDSDNTRIALGIHHKDIRELLKFKLATLGVLTLSGEDSPERKDWIMRNFRTSPERICAINMLAGGVGLDMFYVPSVIILERQWSYADESQFEFRFYNPDLELLAQRGLPNKRTTVEYILAKGTIDSIFHDMIERKKMIEGETIGSNWDLTTQPKLFRELLDETLASRL